MTAYNRDADVREPSWTGAIALAQRHMRDGGRNAPDDSDKQFLAKLLWHVEASDGGFIGASDAHAEALAIRIGVTDQTVHRAMLSPGKWPSASTLEKAA